MNTDAELLYESAHVYFTMNRNIKLMSHTYLLDYQEASRWIVDDFYDFADDLPLNDPTFQNFLDTLGDLSNPEE